ncbi:MAG TPA: hypothetical protein VMS17_25445 [Gemmataceae bacterium]|nr:hypothetical protein [Gemmataceae bacterium]
MLQTGQLPIREELNGVSLLRKGMSGFTAVEAMEHRTGRPKRTASNSAFLEVA